MTMNVNLEGSSQQAKEEVVNKRNGQGPQHLKFFLIVFLILRPKPNTCFHHPSCLRRLLRARAQALIDELQLIYIFVIYLE